MNILYNCAIDTVEKLHQAKAWSRFERIIVEVEHNE